MIFFLNDLDLKIYFFQITNHQWKRRFCFFLNDSLRVVVVVEIGEVTEV